MAVYNNNPTEPVFLLKRDLSPATGQSDTNRYATEALEICLASERVCWKEKIARTQEIRGLWRIYPLSCPARAQLLIESIKLRVRALTLFDKNPFILIGQDGRETPSTKAWISDIPISCDEADIESALVRLGCVLRSSLIFERSRNKDGKLTRFLTGSHFIFIDVPSKPLERKLRVGGFTARLYHKEQPKKEKGSIICSRSLQTGHWVSDYQNDMACLDCRKSSHERGDPARSAVTMLPESVWTHPAVTQLVATQACSGVPAMSSHGNPCQM